MQLTPRSYRFTVAPMMDWSDRHCRYLWRLISKNTLLYTEMVTTGAVIHGDRERFLGFNPEEHPVALQLGGSDPKALAQCAKLAEDWGYDEVNLNCGCPSDRVQQGMIGACLMAHPELVAECVTAMRDAVKIPITVKHRIGLDKVEDFGFLENFVHSIAATGCDTFIVHARNAWLDGLSPKDNREIPPLRYDWVHRLKAENPQLTIILNGGLKDLNSCAAQLQLLDGVMVGREAYHNPYLLAEVDQRFYSECGQIGQIPSRNAIFEQYIEYCRRQLAAGCKLHHLSRHLLGLFQGQPGARGFRRYISENAFKPDAGINVLLEAYQFVI